MSAGTADRVTIHEAKRAFDDGQLIVVSERGHEPTLLVTKYTTTHSRGKIAWNELVGLVREWRGRYPNQRFYVVRPSVVRWDVYDIADELEDVIAALSRNGTADVPGELADLRQLVRRAWESARLDTESAHALRDQRHAELILA